MLKRQKKNQKLHYERTVVERDIVSQKNWINADTTYYVLSANWFAKWNEYANKKLVSPGRLSCKEMICQHSLIAFDVLGALASKLSTGKSNIYGCEFVPERLFQALTKKHGKEQPEIKVRVNSPLKGKGNVVSLVTSQQIDAFVVPGVCPTCEAKWRKKWERSAATALLNAATNALKTIRSVAESDSESEEDELLKRLNERKEAAKLLNAFKEDEEALCYEDTKLSVSLPDGKTITILANSSTTVQQLKEKIFQELGKGFETELQILRTLYVVLTKPNEIISSFGVTPETTLILSLKQNQNINHMEFSDLTHFELGSSETTEGDDW